MNLSIEESDQGFLFKKKYEIITSFSNDIKYAVKKSKVFKNIAIQDLPKNHFYNYIITKNGDTIYGQVENSWEFGVKHAALAAGSDIVVAGEMTVGSRTLEEISLQSGTFMYYLNQKLRQEMSPDQYHTYFESLENALIAFLQLENLQVSKIRFSQQGKHYVHPGFSYALSLCEKGLIPTPTNTNSCEEIKSDFELWQFHRKKINPRWIRKLVDKVVKSRTARKEPS